MNRTFLTGATVVSGDILREGLTVVVEAGRISDLLASTVRLGGTDDVRPLPGRVITPGFIDLHVHGVAGVDVLHGAGAVQRVAALLPRWGVTSFSPTSLACPPDTLQVFLDDVSRARADRSPDSARVLPAHLESNFLNPAYRGAQPEDALRLPDDAEGAHFSGADIRRVIGAHRGDIGIVTLAPEMFGGLDLVRHLVAQGVLASIGHSGATFDEARAAFAAGVSRATHLYSAMPPFSHRDPGLVGAVLSDPSVFAELICDGVHAHPAAMHIAIAAKTPQRLVAITDGTAASGLPRGSRAFLGGRPIVAADAARLEDGGLAGSVLTMDRAFATLVERGLADLPTAARLCATTPAADMRLGASGTIAIGAAADFVVLSPALRVEETWIDGRRVFAA